MKGTSLDTSTTSVLRHDTRRGRAILAASIGNGLEWYDFSVYAYLTPIISVLFFPGRSPLSAILASFAVFAVGFLMRPIGAIALGRFADRRGRKAALILSVAMMGVATVLLGLAPTYAAVGIVAPILLVLARLVQGFSVGGEYGASSTFLVEYAPPGRRGLFGSFAYFSSILGMAVGGGVVLVFSLALSAADMSAWGWRIPFLLSFPLLLIGLYIRRTVADTPDFEQTVAEGRSSGAPLTTLLRTYRKPMAIVFGIVVGFAVATYTVVTFVLSYLRTVLHMETVPATLAVLIATLFGAALIPAFGALSDRIGTKPLLICASIATIVLPMLGFAVLLVGSTPTTYLGLFILWLPVSIFCGVTPAAFALLFPPEVRVSGFGIAYSFGTAIFSGTAPFIATLLVEATGNSTAPAWYIAIAGAVSLVVTLQLPRKERPQAG